MKETDTFWFPGDESLPVSNCRTWIAVVGRQSRTSLFSPVYRIRFHRVSIWILSYRDRRGHAHWLDHTFSLCVSYLS